MRPPLEGLADLIVSFGANVQEGQIVDVGSALGKEDLARAITASAYKRWAKFAEVVFPDPEPEAAFERLWEQVFHVCRLAVADPVAAWRERSRSLGSVADRLSQRHFDAIHLEGPGTDLTIGLLPTSEWSGGGD